MAMNRADAGRPDPTRRFSNRVEDYIRYRPGYPPAVVDLLVREMGLRPDSTVADVGSGTGIFARTILEHGCSVIGVEPNTEMRMAAERLLAGFPSFRSVAGTAEATSLPDQSVSHVTAAQAFHWFDANRTREEFKRILRPGGLVALIWNERLMDTPFLRAFEQLLLDHGTDYHEVGARHARPDQIHTLFASAVWEQAGFENSQVFDFESLKGRLLSASYTPAPGHPRHEPMLTELRRVFDDHQEQGKVRFRYETVVYYGRLD